MTKNKAELIVSDYFVNASERYKKNKPLFEKLYGIQDINPKVGNLALISNDKQIFWNKIVKIEGDFITAIVNQKIITSIRYNVGTVIVFKKEHILRVEKDTKKNEKKK